MRMRLAVALLPLALAAGGQAAHAQVAVPGPLTPLGCAPRHAPSIVTRSSHAVPLVPEWARVGHGDFDRAWRWCEDPKLLVGLNNTSRPGHSFGVHVDYDGTTLGAPSATGFYYLLLGVERSDGTNPEVSLSTSLKLALEGSDEHGCDTIGYDQVELDVHASKVGTTISFEMDVTGTPYMLWPGLGSLWIHEVGTLFYSLHNVVTWASGVLYEPSNLDDAVHTGSSLGLLRFDAHTAMPGMHFQKHGGANPILEVDLDHVCEQVPLPAKPEFTFSMTIATTASELTAEAKEYAPAE